jgi:methionyl-tRNA synthetase
MVSIEDFKKIDIVVGEILAAEKVPETDKLLKLSVDLGLKKFSKENFLPEHSKESNVLGDERDIRVIISGIALYFPDCSVLVGKKCMFVANLEPRIIRGIESQGMILAVSTDPRSAEGSSEARGGQFSLLEPNSGIPAGAQAK